MALNLGRSWLALCVTVPGILLLNAILVLKFILAKLRGGRAGSSPAGDAAAPPVVVTPEARFKDLGFDERSGFPVRWISMAGGVTGTGPLNVAMIDAGPRDAAETVLCLHGEPSWSYLYRDVIRDLVAKGRRVIAPDFVGFGRSEKLTDPEAYSHALHTGTVLTICVELDLRNVTLVVQDWGGLTGLSTLPRIQGRVSRLVIMNTGLPNPGPTYASVPSAAFFLLWRSLAAVLGTWLPIGHLVAPGTPRVAAYNAPFPTAAHKAGAAAWPLMVPMPRVPALVGAALRCDPRRMPKREMREGKAILDKWTRPTLVMFSDGDPVTVGQERAFLDWIPAMAGVKDALRRDKIDPGHVRELVSEGVGRMVTVAGAGHFLQDTHGAVLARHIDAFIESTPGLTGDAVPRIG